MDSSLFDVASRSVMFFVILAGFLLSFELGFAIGKWRRVKHRDEEKNVGPMVAGVLGLLAFVLAMSFSMAASRHDQRKQNVLSDANAISTAYLRAYLVDEAQGSKIRDMLEEYTELRAHFTDYEEQSVLLNKVQAIQVDIWKEVIALSKTSPGAQSASLGAALNEVFDLHEKRINDAVYNRFEASVWIIIISIVMLGMLMLGVQGGLNGKKGMVGLIPFALALAAMVSLIVDLDRPQSGMFIVSQQPMLDTLESIRNFESSAE